jgi:phosphate starvation-inducible protein PhoH
LKKKIKKKLDDYSKNISFEDNLILPVIYGRNDENLKMLENNFNISILPRGNFLRIQGNQNNVKLTL